MPTRTRPVNEVAIVRRGNTIVQLLSEYDPVAGTTSDMDLSSITRMLLYILKRTAASSVEVVKTIDSDDDASAITWVGNAVTLDVGGLVTDLDPGVYLARLTGVDGAGDATELIHEDLPSSSLLLRIGGAEAVA